MDARFPERWLNNCRMAQASDSQFRLFVNANAWAVSNRTDGYIPAAELSLIPRANTADAAALVDLGLWEGVQDGWMIEGFLTVQTPKSQLDGLDERRAKDARRSRKYRNKKAASRDESRDGTRDSSHDDKGQARTGQAPYREPTSEAEESNWGTADSFPIARTSSSVPAGLKSADDSDVLACSMCGNTKPLNEGGRCDSCQMEW